MANLKILMTHMNMDCNVNCIQVFSDLERSVCRMVRGQVRFEALSSFPMHVDCQKPTNLPLYFWEEYASIL